MSFNVNLSSFRDGEPFAIDEQCVREAFGSALVSSGQERDTWRLEYGDDSCDIFVTRLPVNGSGISGLTIQRPLADRQLWDSIHQVLECGNILLFYLGCPAPLVANERTSSHVPALLLEALGSPVAARSGADIIREWALVSPGHALRED